MCHKCTDPYDNRSTDTTDTADAIQSHQKRMRAESRRLRLLALGVVAYALAVGGLHLMSVHTP